MPNRLLSALASSPLLAFALVGVFTTALVVGPAGGASAHAELESSDPKDGAGLTARPAQVTLTFAEQIDAGTARSRVSVAADDDADYTYDPQPRVDGENVVVPLESVTEGGEYTVTYRVVSEDGHPVEGSVRFAVATASATEGAGGSTSEESPDDSAATATPTAAPTTGSLGVDGDADGGNPAWLYLVGGLAVLAAGGTAVALVTRRPTP